MKQQLDDLLGELLSRWVGFVLERAQAVVVLVLVLALVLLGYSAAFLGVNSDNVSLLDEDVPSRRALDEPARVTSGGAQVTTNLSDHYGVMVSVPAP